MAEGTTAARQAAELMALLCSNQGTPRVRDELASLLAMQRIPLSDFCAALSALANERGAVADEWEQDADGRSCAHNWRLRKAEDVPLNGQTAYLDVRLACARCLSIATFRTGVVPPCRPGQLWQWTGHGWYCAEERAGG